MFESRFMLITCRIIFLELKKRYSIFWRLADNLLTTKEKKTSYVQDLIMDTADDACSGENEKLFEHHPHSNDKGCQGT